MYIPVIDVEATCRNLKKLCEEKGLSVKDLQSALNLGSCQTIYKWFAGKNIPSIDNFVIILDVLNVTFEEILVTRVVHIIK